MRIKRTNKTQTKSDKPQPKALPLPEETEALPVPDTRKSPAPRNSRPDALTADLSNHRQRLILRYINGGVDAMPDYELLEMVLFYALPRRDTKPLAKALLLHFGSLTALFRASIDELMTVPGVGERTAVLLSTYGPFMQRCSRESMALRKTLSSPQEAGEWMMANLPDGPDEMVMVVTMNAKNEILHYGIVTRGTPGSVQLPSRRIAQTVLLHHGTKVILGHNHPGGTSRLSKEDVAATRHLANLLKQMDIQLADHIVVARNEFISMNRLGYL